MRERRHYDEGDFYAQARDVVLDACAELARLDDLTGMPTAAVLSYITVDEHGEEWTGRFYVGGLNTAIGLASRSHNALLAQDLEDE